VTTLLLVRHGETVGNSRIRYFGRTDLELSPLGRAQMAAARGWIDEQSDAAGTRKRRDYFRKSRADRN
jgi:broad specificity phosphatase PhoE